MSNVCTVKMQIISDSIENIKDFFKYIYAYNRNVPSTEKYIVFETDPYFYEENVRETTYNGHLMYSLIVYGSTRNSVYSSMLRKSEKGSSYINIQTACANSNVALNIYSSEYGNCFEEHVVVNSTGDVITDDSLEATEYYFDPDEYSTIEEFNHDHHTNFTEEDFDENNSHIEGGYGDWEELYGNEAFELLVNRLSTEL